VVPGDRVLDIGCGPGTFTLPFTLNAASVTGIDPSAVMLSKAESTAAATGIGNLRTVRTTWESYEPEAPYDLVFTAFCPGIHDRRTLWKMEKASRRSCCYVTGDVGQFRLLSQLWGDVSGEPCSCDAWNILYPFEILRKAGRNPQLHLFRQPSLEAAPAPDLVDEFVAYFRSFPGPAMAGREQIRRHIDSISKNGHVELCRERKIWMLSWNVPQ
jgi:SAM-dependent methyltransferase